MYTRIKRCSFAGSLMIILCCLVLHSCKKSQDKENSPMEFLPMETYIAGTTSLSLDEVVSPYALYLGNNNQATFITITGNLTCTYTLSGKILTVEHPYATLRFDLKNLKKDGVIQDVTSSAIQKLLINYAVCQPRSATSVFGNQFLNKSFTGNLVEAKNYGTKNYAYAGYLLKFTPDITTQLPTQSGFGTVYNQALISNDIISGLDGYAALRGRYLAVRVKNDIEIGIRSPGEYLYAGKLTMKQ